jgi:mannosyltransferase OCH1-like enzyme
MIPKIIHQTAYSNKNEWHPIWKICQQSVLKNFKGFDYKFWDDDSLDNFVKEKYPKIYEEYKNFPSHILQLDCVRYLLLHHFGGIYIDMDIYCYDSFFDELKENIYLVESINDELVQNSLMASIPNHPFWMDCCELTIHRTKTIKLKTNYSILPKKEADENDSLIRFISGPLMLSDCLRKTKHSIYILPHKYFNHEPWTYKKEYKTKHMQSGMWGKEIKDSFYRIKIKDNLNIPLEEYHKYSYKMKTSIDLNNFDFYKDYSSI